jgi:pimeloyl-ACP methyl ester carboxylesterase
VGSSAAAGPPGCRSRLKRFARRWIIRLVVGYLLVCFVMWLLENWLVFYPVPATQAWNNPPDPAIQDVFLTSPEGTRIHAWWLPRRPDAPVLLLFPGNAGNLSGRGESMVRIADRLDSSVLIFDYPGYGKSEGSPNEPNCYDAAEGAVRWLRDVQQVSPERVAFYGESLGGGVATELARRYPCRALILVKTFTSLPAVAKRHYPWLPCHWLMSNRFDTISKLPENHCPVFIASATNDQVVPYAHGESLFRAANEPKLFFRDEGSDHNDPLPDAFWEELRGFLGKIGP